MNFRRMFAGTGRRRAVDCIPRLRARLADADTLIVSLVHERNTANRNARSAMRGLEQAALELEAALTENAALATENDELAHRLIAANAEIANLKMIRCPAPADWPAEADTEELVMPLWDALNTPTAA